MDVYGFVAIHRTFGQNLHMIRGLGGALQRFLRAIPVSSAKLLNGKNLDGAMLGGAKWDEGHWRGWSTWRVPGAPMLQLELCGAR